LKQGVSPRLATIPDHQITAALINRLRLATVHVDWASKDTDSEVPFRLGKVKVLLDIIDFIPKKQYQFDEQVLSEAMTMISSNLFRSLPATLPESAGNENEEEAVPFDPIWPFLRWVYDFFLRFIVGEVDPRVLKKHITGPFVLKLLELFNSKDRREREYLKNLLHRIYAKFMSLRAFIRRAMNHVFHTFIYETEDLAGVAEMLEILGSIINGFALPLKTEHRVFFTHVLTPMHKVRTLPHFYQQLTYCICQFIEKDQTLAPPFIRGLVRYWRTANSVKETRFLSELDEVIEIVGTDHYDGTAPDVIAVVASCVRSPHYQVAERALEMVMSGHFLQLAEAFPEACRETLIPALVLACDHWNGSIETLAQSALTCLPPALKVANPDEALRQARADLAAREERRAAHAKEWAAIEESVKDIVSMYPPPPPRDPANELPLQ
jgi:serine/threonine-protein phosphatase 2A regulatory subunit B'